MVDLKDFIMVIIGIIFFPGLFIFFAIRHVKKDTVKVMTTRAKQIDPLTWVQLPETPGTYDTPDTIVLAEDMEVVTATGDDD